MGKTIYINKTLEPFLSLANIPYKLEKPSEFQDLVCIAIQENEIDITVFGATGIVLANQDKKTAITIYHKDIICEITDDNG